MKVITCKYIYKNGEFLKNKAIAFNKNIIKIAPVNKLKKEFPNAKYIKYNKNSVLYPGFINPHVHLEFSANISTLNYGNFIEWLNSIIGHREELISKLNSKLIKQKTNEMLQSGVTTFGTISSFGGELDVCKNLKQRVIYFNEIIGSNPAAVDTLFEDFKTRLYESLEAKSERFIPAIAIHSPYSVHPFLIREVLKIAKEQNLPTTAHFLESKAEQEWLESGTGEFLEFFKKFSSIKEPLTTIEAFLKAFDKTPTLFTHAVQAKDKEIEYINSHKHSIIHCPRSNRLLGCGKLKIDNIKNLCLGTDGLSSNYSLSILEELKVALFIQEKYNLKELSLKLIESITKTPANALKLNIGELKDTFKADFVIFTLPDDLNNFDSSLIALQTIINCQKAEAVYIDGEEVVPLLSKKIH